MFDKGEAARRLVLNAARFSGAARLLSRRLGGVGAILMVHRVTAAPAKPLGINRHLNVAPAFLDAAIGEMKRLGYAFVTMDEALDRLAAGPGSGRFATITADDGYRDNLVEALPVLEKHGAPMTIYVAPGLTGRTTDLWWDVLEDVVTAREEIYLTTPAGRVALDCTSARKKIETNRFVHDYLTTELPEEQRQPVLRAIASIGGIDPQRPSRETLMDWDEVRRAAAHPLIAIGAHTVSHYNLKRLPREAAWNEMVDAARIIELETGERPRHFAYPYGYESAVGEREVELAAAAGFASAVTTRHGVIQAAHATHRHALPRISVNGRYQKVAHLRTMLSGVTGALANSGRTLVTV
jgi:peptidoglycan/xylan/chitin deacetylase (PgdA/CDA1 family)